jgi:hypothetical protein
MIVVLKQKKRKGVLIKKEKPHYFFKKLWGYKIEKSFNLLVKKIFLRTFYNQVAILYFQYNLILCLQIR